MKKARALDALLEDTENALTERRRLFIVVLGLAPIAVHLFWALGVQMNIAYVKVLPMAFICIYVLFEALMQLFMIVIVWTLRALIFGRF